MSRNKRIIMTRREIRECIFCLLFQYNFYEEEEFTEQMANFLTEKKLSETNEMEIREKIDRLTEKLPDIDEKIAANAKGWKLDRIAKAELAILRLAVFEALYDESVPVGVAINEAVELAKMYGEENGYVFVNGILGKIVNE